MKEDPDHTYIKDELTGDNILAGHEYDGIMELDNRLPKWWLGLFYITIIFAVIYTLRYHVLKTADLQDMEYDKEVSAAEEKYKAAKSGEVDASTLTVLTDPASMEAGKAIYDKNCSVCHLSKGEGLVGPNMTDEYWIHGGSMEDVYNLIVVGVPAKGMISWKDQLSPTEIQQVASYIFSLQGTNPPNAKAPEGEIYVRE